MAIFLVEEVRRNNGFWDPKSRRVKGYVSAGSESEVTQKIGAITTSCDTVLGRIHVRDWRPKRGWLITKLKIIHNPSSL